MNVTKSPDFRSDDLKYQNVAVKESTDQQTGKPIKYKRIFTSHIHKSADGSPITGRSDYQLECDIKFPRGLWLEDGKLTGRAVFDMNNPAAVAVADKKSRLSKKGWIKNSDVKTIKKTIKIYKAVNEKKAINMYGSPSEDSDIMGSIPKGTEMDIENESDDGEWILIETGGRDGFLSQLAMAAAKIIYENRKEIGVDKKSPEEIYNDIKHPVNFPTSEESGELTGEGIAYFKVTYFQARPAQGNKPAWKENYARFTIPQGKDEHGNRNPPIVLGLKEMVKSSMSGKAVIGLNNIYFGGSRISLQLYIKSFVINEIKPVEKQSFQQDLEDKLGEDAEFVKRLANQYQALKLSNGGDDEEVIPPLPPKQKKVINKGFNLQEMLDSGPVLEDTVNESADADDLNEDFNIPGLPNL